MNDKQLEQLEQKIKNNILALDNIISADSVHSDILLKTKNLIKELNTLINSSNEEINLLEDQNVDLENDISDLKDEKRNLEDEIDELKNHTEDGLFEDNNLENYFKIKILKRLFKFNLNELEKITTILESDMSLKDIWIKSEF